MTATATRRAARRQPGRPLKSPLAVPSGNPASRAEPGNTAGGVDNPELPPRTL